jgi:ribosome-associated heat shock protein Hsp15
MEMDNGKVRLDKWLWAARFFKTRTLAMEAIAGGKVHLNGNRVKPAHVVDIGDLLEIRKGPYIYIVIVKELSIRRGAAQTARLLYEETQESETARLRLVEMHRLSVLANPRTDKRPNKKQRRQIIRFTGKGTAQ